MAPSRWLLSRVTVDIVMQANPDGAVRDQRHNHDPSASGPYTAPGVGYDINRFHNPLTPMTHLAGANVSRYPGEPYECVARNAYGILGSASLLVELSNLPAEQIESQIRSAFVSMIATAQGAADRSPWRIDPARADAVPPRGPSIPSGAAVAEAAERWRSATTP
jgi:hypothetical protein